MAPAPVQSAAPAPRRPALPLRQRYLATLLGGVALLLVAVVVFGWISFARQRTALVTELYAQADQLQWALVTRMDVASTHVLAMRRTVERNTQHAVLSDTGFMDRIQQRNPSPLRDALWDRLPNALAMETGAIHMDPDTLDAGGLRRDLSAVSGMLAEVAATHAWHKAFQQSYYLDAGKRWRLVYPPQSRDALLTATGKDNMRDAFTVLFNAFGTLPIESAGPARNPDKLSVWTRPHPDATGKGLVASLLAPVYADGVYTGAVGADVSLDLLDAVLTQGTLRLGRALVVDAEGLVLADSNGGLKNATAALPLAQLLSPEVAAVAQTGSDPTWTRLPLRGSNWTLLVHTPASDVNARALNAVKPYLILTVLLLAALAGLAYVQHTRYTQPALQLADYIAQVEAPIVKRPPVVPAFWKASFDQVARSAQDRRKQQASAMQQANQLQAGAHQYEAGLRGASTELSAALDNALAAVTTLEQRRLALLEQLQGSLKRSHIDALLADLLQANAQLEHNLKTAREFANRFKILPTESAGAAAAPAPDNPLPKKLS